MNKITTRAGLIDWIKVELGEPVIRVNVAQQQIDQQIDKALQFFWEWHRDGSRETYFGYEITATDVTNGYITLPDNVDDVVQIVPKSQANSSTESFATISWQMSSAVWNMNNAFYMISPVDYFLALQSYDNIATITGSNVKAFEFEKYKRRLTPRFEILEGDIILVNAYRNLDPESIDEDAIEVFNDPWLKEYAACLVKQAWGNNLKKFAGVRLPGNIDLNGQQIFDEANQDRIRLEEVLKNEHQAPPMFFVG